MNSETKDFLILRFRQRTNETDYIVIDSLTLSCRSAIGKIGGEQKVRCGNCKIDGNLHYGRILHELFHGVGKQPFRNYILDT